MDKQELITELLNYLDSAGHYQAFLTWEEDRGYDRDELDTELEAIRDE